MDDQSASGTALAAALMRAIHTRRDQPALIDDPWGDRLVSDAEKAALCERIRSGVSEAVRRRLERLDSVEAVLDAVLRTHPTYGGVILRSRFAEDALHAAVARGVGQYVLIGAGLDSFLLRQPSWTRDLQLFEVDHPATQTLKRERLAACGATIPANVQFVPVDLSREPLPAALARGGFSGVIPAFFSWLGVTIYLSRAANLTTLRAVGGLATPGSELVFTYTDQRAFAVGAAGVMADVLARRAAEGEPWVTGFDPAALAGDLRPLGLEVVEDLNGPELLARYGVVASQHLAIGPTHHVACARIGGD